MAFLVVAGGAGAVLVLTGHDRVSTSTGPAPLVAFAVATLAVVLLRRRRPAAAITGGFAAAALVLAVAVGATAKLDDNPLRAAQRGHAPASAPLTGRGLSPHEVVTSPKVTPPPTSESVTERTSDRGQTPSLTSDRGQTPSPAPAPSLTPREAGEAPRDVVLAYYADLNARDFRGAWRHLTPEVQKSFGGFAAWSKGFATTLASVPTAVTADGDTVRLTLVAADRTACGGVVTTRYAVRWQLAGERGAALSATPVTPPAATGCVSP